MLGNGTLIPLRQKTHGINSSLLLLNMDMRMRTTTQVHSLTLRSKLLLNLPDMTTKQMLMAAITSTIRRMRLGLDLALRLRLMPRSL